MTPEAAKFRANDAKALLENPLFKEAFGAVEQYLQTKLITCDASDKEAAQKAVLSVQLLHAVKREIERVVENGLIADIRISELERKKFSAIFRR